MKLILSLITVIISFSVVAQNNEYKFFSNDSSLINNFNYFVDSVNNKNSNINANDLKSSFALMLNHDFIDDKHVKEICDVMNVFFNTSKSLDVYSKFIEATCSFPNEFNIKDFQNWAKAIKASEGNIDHITKWKDFFKNNCLYQSPIFIWERANGKAKIEFKDNVSFIEIADATIHCNLYDSIVIDNFSGRYLFNTQTLIGNKGKISWAKAGLDESDVYALLPKNFSINLKRSDLTIDSVSFYYKKYFKNKPILGKLKDKCLNRAEDKNAIYPKFEPYNDFVEIDNMYEDVSFSGNFVLDGNKITGSGSDDDKAQLTIYHDKEPLMQLFSKHFSFTPTNFSSKDAEMLLFIDDDTIHHPSCLSKYVSTTHELKITRDYDRSGAAPFHSTYHKLNIYSDVLSWNLNDDVIIFEPEATFSKGGVAYFESDNYFSEERFRQFETPDGVNMLLSILNYSRKNMETFYLSDIASFCKISEDQVKAILLNIADYGLISYNHNEDQITVNQKLHQYIANRSKKRDYDIISIYSEVKDGANAKLHLETLTLQIVGVDRLVMSEKGNVVVYPYDKSIEVISNMNMHFNGYIRAGLIDIYAQHSHFRYADFKIELPQVDSVSFYFYTDEYDLTGNRIIDKIYSPIENLNGYLEIDKYFNKSGVIDDNKEYPRFWSTDSAFVYYQKPDVCNNVYTKDKFYFLIDPFMVDSLATYIADNISFSGEFVSNGIFDNFRENLVIMPGQSLGFEHTTPQEGYNIFGDKGSVNGTITMSNECLQVDGELNYLTSTMYSDKFFIYPDSINSIVNNFIINEDENSIKYAAVNGEKADIHFSTEDNNLIFSTIDNNSTFDIYNRDYNFTGALTYSETGINCNGQIKHGKGTLNSNKFNIYKQHFDADTVLFTLFDESEKYSVSEATNYSTIVDIPESLATFSAIDKTNSGMTFKDNGFKALYDSFAWHLIDNTLQLGDNERITVPTSFDMLIPDSITNRHLVYSISKKSDSLNFRSSFGNYDYDNSMLTFNNIDYIQVSDAAIIPADRSVSATIGGALMPINDGYVVINIDNEYHTLHQTNTTIKSRHDFSGSGYYNYVDANDNITPVFVEKITGKDSTVKAIAIISDLNPLPLNPIVDFQGTMTLTNNSEDINLSGYYHVKQSCFENDTWIKLAHNADPDSLMLPINRNYLSINEEPIFSGLSLSKPGAVVYPCFLSEKTKTTDWSIMNVEGMLSFTEDEYIINDSTKKFAGLKESHIALHPNNCTMTGSDEFNLFERQGRIDIATAGDIWYNFMNDSIIIDISLFLDFHFNDAALEVLSTELLTANTNYSVPEDNQLHSAMNFIMPEKEFTQYYEGVSLFGSGKTPELLKSNIVISHAKLVWNDERKVFYTIEPFTIYSINGVVINKTIDGAMEISKMGGTESITILMNPKSDFGSNRYFFFYHNNNMFTFSTNDNFSDLIRNDKKKVRRLKRKKGLPAYQYIIATSERFGEFCRRYGF